MKQQQLFGAGEDADGFSGGVGDAEEGDYGISAELQMENFFSCLDKSDIQSKLLCLSVFESGNTIGFVY